MIAAALLLPLLALQGDPRPDEGLVIERTGGEVVRLRPSGGFRLWTTRALGDVDGDGADDLLLTGAASSCMGPPPGYAYVVSGREMRVVDRLDGEGRFVLDMRAERALILTFEDPARSAIELRDSLLGDTVWRVNERSSSIGAPIHAAFVDRGADQVADVALLSLTGGLALVKGVDGAVMWTFEVGEGVSVCVIDCGDQDRDGMTDLAALVLDGGHRRIEIVSGEDGRSLRTFVLPRGDLTGGRLQSVGDLDGDGLPELSLGAEGIVSIAAGRFLDVADGWTLVFATGAGDLDGDGRDDLVLGRAHPATGERRIATYSAAGLLDLEVVATDEPAWGKGEAAVGDFDGDGRWDLALTVEPKGRFSRELRILFGREWGRR